MTTLGRLGGSAKKISATVNTLSKSCISDYFEHGDPSAANKMLAVLPNLKGVQVKKLAKYFQQIIPAKFDKKSMTFGKQDSKRYEDCLNKHTDFINAYNWFDFELPRNSAPKTLKPETMVASIRKQIEAAEADHTVTAAQLQELKKGIDTLIAEKLNALVGVHAQEEFQAEKAA